MQRKSYTIKEKGKVKQLILAGKSYREIREAFGVPKSTVSNWFGKTIKKPITRKAMLEHLARIRKLANIALKNKWEKKRKEEAQLLKVKIEKEIKNYPLENIGFYKSLLAMLYWAEGTRCKRGSGVIFVNTDPDLMLLFITLLRKCYSIDENKFSIWLRVHYYHSIRKVKSFWSKLLNVPLNQFIKVSIKKRSKTKRFKKNFAGICAIRSGNTNIRKELIEIGSTLQKLIIKNAPIAQWIERETADFEVVGSTPTGRTNVSILYRGKFFKP